MCIDMRYALSDMDVTVEHDERAAAGSCNDDNSSQPTVLQNIPFGFG